MKELNKIYNEDCLIGMKDIPDKSIVIGGWLGNSNGYFVSGIFKTNEGVSYDYSGTPQNEKYWYLFNTITYDKPVKTD